MELKMTERKSKNKIVLIYLKLIINKFNIIKKILYNVNNYVKHIYAK